jgi:Helix-turn-helix domain
VEVQLANILSRLEKIESLLLDQRKSTKEWYTTAEVAELLGKAEFTIREWCRNKRIHCQKRSSGRGAHKGWVITGAEVTRIQREGLLPLSYQPEQG